MKRIFSSVVSAVLIACLVFANLISVQAKEIVQVQKKTLLEDFEGSSAILKKEGYDFLGLTMEIGNNAKNSGTHSLRLFHSGNLGGDPITEFKIDFAGLNTDFSTVDYMDFWVKNTSDSVLGLTWLRLNDTLCCNKSYIQNSNGEFVENLTIIPNTTGSYTDANGNNWKKVWEGNPVVAIPANYTGWLRLELSGDGKHASTDHMDLGLLPSADGRHELFIDDITLVHNTMVDKFAPPTGLEPVAPTSDTAADGKIKNVTDEMEYRAEGATTYTAVTGTEITGLAAGVYYIRYKATETVLASDDVAVTIPGYVAPPKDDHLRMVNNFNTAAKVAEAKGKEYPFLAGEEFQVGKMPGKDSNCVMLNFREDTNNPLQKVLITTKTGDLTKADFIQLQINWTSEYDLQIRPAFADATMGNATWYYKMVDENPGWEDTDEGKFWKDWILIKGNSQSVVGTMCLSVELYIDGKWQHAEYIGGQWGGYKLPAGYSGYIRFELPQRVKKADRDGVCLEFMNGEKNFSGVMYLDDLMIGIKQAEDENYPYAFTEYVKNETELKDPEEPGQTPDDGDDDDNDNDDDKDDNGTTAPSTDDSKNPKTGDTSAACLAGIAALLAASFCAVSFRRKQQF